MLCVFEMQKAAARRAPRNHIHTASDLWRFMSSRPSLAAVNESMRVSMPIVDQGLGYEG